MFNFVKMWLCCFGVLLVGVMQAFAHPPLERVSDELLTLEISLDHTLVQGYYTSPETQAEHLVNQGFYFLNLFDYIDAFRSFHQALILDDTLMSAHMGQGFAVFYLGPKHQKILESEQNWLLSHQEKFSEPQRAWAQFFFSVTSMQGYSDSKEAYQDLRNKDSHNLEVDLFANWASKSYDLSPFENILKQDPQNLPALHYLYYLSEGSGQNDQALAYAQRLSMLAPDSGHLQHLYGHILPHFQRWEEAEAQLARAHRNYVNWAIENQVSPEQNWHYVHNLDLWATTNMILNPAKAILILEELQGVVPSYAQRLLDFYVLSVVEVEDADNKLKQFESESEEMKRWVFSSRLLYKILYSEQSFTALKAEADKSFEDEIYGENSVALSLSLNLIEASLNAESERVKQVQSFILRRLRRKFKESGAEGWNEAVLETLIYKRVFEVYKLTKSLEDLETQIISEFISSKED